MCRNFGFFKIASNLFAAWQLRSPEKLGFLRSKIFRARRRWRPAQDGTNAGADKQVNYERMFDNYLFIC